MSCELLNMEEISNNGKLTGVMTMSSSSSSVVNLLYADETS